MLLTMIRFLEHGQVISSAVLVVHKRLTSIASPFKYEVLGQAASQGCRRTAAVFGYTHSPLEFVVSAEEPIATN